MRLAAAVIAMLGLAACQPLAEGQSVPDLVPIGEEPALDPNLVFDDDPGMGCYPTDVRTGERVDICVWVEP